MELLSKENESIAMILPFFWNNVLDICSCRQVCAELLLTLFLVVFCREKAIDFFLSFFLKKKGK